MTLAGSFEIALTLTLVLIAAYPLGALMADLFENRRTFLTPILGPVERGLYRLAGVDPEAEQEWFEYAISMVAFGLFLKNSAKSFCMASRPFSSSPSAWRYSPSLVQNAADALASPALNALAKSAAV